VASLSESHGKTGKIKIAKNQEFGQSMGLFHKKYWLFTYNPRMFQPRSQGLSLPGNEVENVLLSMKALLEYIGLR